MSCSESSVRSTCGTSRSMSAAPEEPLRADALKRRHQDCEPEYQFLGSTNKRQHHYTLDNSRSPDARHDTHEHMACQDHSDSIQLLEGMQGTIEVAGNSCECNRCSVGCFQQPSLEILKCPDTIRTVTRNCGYQTEPHQHPGPNPDNYESTPDTADDEYDFTSIETHDRGRTPERDEWPGKSIRTRCGSRTSSTSSARSMINERMEWAHQDRMRSASRDNSFPPSPFLESSPFYSDFDKSLSLATQPRVIHKCECCPKKPKMFDTEDELRYVSILSIM
jgi:hypothetical protein